MLREINPKRLPLLNLEGMISNCEMEAVKREQSLFNELAIAQGSFTANDVRLRKELEETQQARISDALDVHFQEQRCAQNLQEQATKAILESQHEMVQQFQANFQQYKQRPKDEHRSVVCELQEQNEDLQDQLEVRSSRTCEGKEFGEARCSYPKGSAESTARHPRAQDCISDPVSPRRTHAPNAHAIPHSASSGTVCLHEHTATTQHAPATQKAPEDPGRSSVPGETALSAAEHGTPSLGNHAHPCAS